jgi:hypothetical protein
MSYRIPSAAFAILLGMCASADASEVLAGGPLYGADSSQGGGITCRIFNAGNTRVRFTQNRIFDNTGAEVPILSDTCTVLAPTKTCFYSTLIVGNLAYSCRSVTNDTTNSLTGTIEILNHDRNAVVQQQPLRSNELSPRQR